MNPDLKLSRNGNLGFSLLVLLLICLRLLAELLNSRKNPLSIWGVPSLAEKIYELNYYKSFLEDGKKLITSSESKKVQVNWDMLLDNKICLRVVQSNTYKNTVTISYNEIICRKIFSFYIFTSFSSRGRDDWKK
jgi:hypothetical protein